MTPHSLYVQYDRCRLTLNLPVYFEEMTIEKIRKVFKLIADRPYQNETARETLDQFFPAWVQDIKDRLGRAEADLTAAKRDAEEKRRTVAALGSTLDENIAQAKRWLAHAKKRRTKRPDEISEYTAALKKATRPKDEHLQAVKEVKRLENTVKQLKAGVERSGKIINAYKNIG